jgi:hypothetical protein
MDDHTHSTADDDRTDDETTPGADGWGARLGFRSDARAASETVGTVLLIGMVATGIVVVSVAGAGALSSLQTDIDQEENEVQVREVDSRLSSLSQSGATSAELSFSRDSVESIDVRTAAPGAPSACRSAAGPVA